MRYYRWILLFACIAFNVAAVPTGAWAAEGAEDLFKKGRAAFDAGDIVGAMPLLKKAADAGHPKAQAAYAYLLDESDYDTEAATYYKLAADQGDPDGYFGLAGLHINGHAGLAQDNATIVGLLEKAARGGHSQAIISLATAYIGGGLGLDGAALTSPVALEWIRKAADLDDITANEALRDAYQNGRFGLTIDPGRANELDKKIAKLKGIEHDTSKKKRRSRL